MWGLGLQLPQREARQLSSSWAHYCMASEMHPVAVPCIPTRVRDTSFQARLNSTLCLLGICNKDTGVASTLNGCQAVSHVVQAQRKNGINPSHCCSSSKVCLLPKGEGLSFLGQTLQLALFSLPLRDLRAIVHKDPGPGKGVIPHF